MNGCWRRRRSVGLAVLLVAGLGGSSIGAPPSRAEAPKGAAVSTKATAVSPKATAISPDATAVSPNAAAVSPNAAAVTPKTEVATPKAAAGSAGLLTEFVKPMPGDVWTARGWDPAPLWSWLDPDLDDGLADAVRGLGLQPAVDQKKLAVALVDITDVRRPRVAAVNGDTMLYAASLPKIAVLLAVFQRAEEGRLQIDDETYRELLRMVRRSSNEDATALMRKVGDDYIARVLLSPRYRLYDPLHNGGLWAGKEYAQVGAWRRDPMYNLSHAATPMQVARFFYLLETGRLVSPEASLKMKEILGHSAIDHKFVRGIREIHPSAVVYRKSGTWGNHHADGALVERRDGARYIAVGLAESDDGGEWLKQLIVQMDRLIDADWSASRLHRARVPVGQPQSVSAGG